MTSGVQVGSAYVELGGDIAPLHSALNQANRAVQGWAESTQSSMRRIAEVAAGTLIGNVIPSITRGFVGLAAQGFEAVASYERLGMSLQALTAKELRQQSVVTETHNLGQRRIELTEQERAKLHDLGLDRDLYAAKLQEETERHRQLVAKWGEEGLAVKTHAASMAKLQEKYNETAAAMATLEGKQGKFVTLTSTTSKTTLSMADAMAQAGPKAKELQGWIEKLAIKSPFKQEDIAQAFRLALSYGFVSDSTDKNVVSSKRLTQAMVDFTSATGASGETMKNVSLALGQMSKTGKVTGQDLTQLAGAGINVDQILAKAFGKSTAEIVKMREKGLIPADKAILAIVQSLEEDFGGAAAAQASSLSGLTASLSDIKEIGLRNFFTGVFTAMQPVLAGLVDTLSSDTFRERITAFGTTLGNIVSNLIAQGKVLLSAFQSGGLGGLLGALGISPEAVSYVTGFVASISSLAATIQGALGQALAWLQTTVLPALGQAVAFVVQNWEGFKGALLAVGSLIAGTAVMGILSALGGALAALLSPVTLMIGAVAALGYAWSTNFMGIQTTVLPIINAIKDGIAAFVSSLQSGQSIFTAVGSALNNLLTPLIGVKDAMSVSTGVMTTLQGIWNTLVDTFNRVKLAVENAVNTFNLFTNMGASPFEAISQAVESFLGVLFGFDKVSPIFDGVREIWAQLVAFFEPTIERLKAAVGPMIESFAPLGDKLKALWEAAKPALTLLAEIVGAVLVGAFNLLLEVIAAVMPSIGSIIGNGIDAATAFLNFFVTLVTNVVAAVKDLIAGDFSGAWGHVQTIIGSAVDTVKTILGDLLANFSLIFSAIVTALVNWVTNIDSEAGTRLAAFVANIAAKIKDIPVTFRTKFNEVTEFLKKIDLAEIGRNLIISLANAMWEKATTYLREKVRDIAALLPQVVRDLLNMHSPSLVFAEIGQQIIEGLSLGLSESQQVAIDALSKVFENLTNIANALSLLAGYRAMPSVLTSLNTMIGQIKEIIVLMADLAGWMAANEWAYQSAKAGSDPIVGIANNIKTMVDGLQALGDFKPVGDIAARVADLVAGYKVIVLQFADLAGYLANEATGLGDAVAALGVMAVVADSFGVIFQAWSAVAKAGTLTGPKNMQAMLASISDMLTQVVAMVGGLKLDITDEMLAFAGRLADLAGAFGTIAKAWEALNKIDWGGSETVASVAMKEVVGFLRDFASQVMTALDDLSKTAPAVGEGFQTFLANVKAAIGLIADVAKAWETVSDFQPNAKLNVATVVDWLASLAGLATKAIEKVQSWGGITPNETFNAFVTSVKGAIGLIADTAKAWETLGKFEWNSGLQMDGDNGVVNWLASLAGLATRAIERVQAWGGITPNETFNTFVTSVKNSIGLIADTAKAWESLQDFKPNNKKLDMNAVVDWLASLGGLALRALEGVQKWGGITPDEAFTAFTTAIKNSLGSLSEALKFTSDLALWKHADNVKGQMQALTADLKVIIDELWLAYVNMRGFVNDSLLKFVADVSALTGGLANVVALLKSIEDLSGTGDITFAVARIKDMIQSVLTGLQDIILTIDEEKGGLIQNFSTAVSGLMGALKSAIDLITEIPDQWGTPDPAMWNSFTNWVQGVFDHFYNWVTNWHVGAGSALPVLYTGEGLNLVGQFAGALSSLMSGLKQALDLALAVPATWATPDASKWSAFEGWVQGVFDHFYNWVTNWHVGAGSALPVQYTGEGLNLVGQFAGALSSLMGGLKQALDLALAVPATWATPDPSKWSAFEGWIKDVFDSFATWIQAKYGATGGPAQLALMASFGTALQSLTAGLATALQLAIAVPATFKAPTDATWAPFDTWVKGVFESFRVYVVAHFTGPDAKTQLDLIAAFGAAMSAVMGGLKSALDLALALPSKWEGVPTGAGSPYANLKAFVEKVWGDFAAYVATNFPKDSTAVANLPVVKSFAEAMSAVMGALGSALDVMKGLQGYIPLLNTRIKDFIGSVTYAYGLVQTYATGAGVAAGTAATKAFAEATSAVFSALTTALGLFKALVEPGNGLTASVDDFKTRLSSLVSRISIVLGAWKTYVETEANTTWGPTSQAFKTKIDGVFGTLKTALDLFSALNTTGMPSPSQISAFLTQVLGLFSSFVTGIGTTPAQVGTAATATDTTLSNWRKAWEADAMNWYNVGWSFAGMFGAGWGASMKFQTQAGSFMLQSTIAVTEAIKTAIKTAFGIHSPSSVMHGFGLNVAAGLGLGMLGGLPDVQAAAASLYQAAQPGMNLGGSWDVNNSRVITVRFEGQAGGGVPLTPQQFDQLTRQLSYQIRIGA